MTAATTQNAMATTTRSTSHESARLPGEAVGRRPSPRTATSAPHVGQRAAPPGSPAEGDTYIVAPSATGGWSGHDKAFACWLSGAWSFRAPAEGWLAYVLDTAELAVYAAPTTDMEQSQAAIWSDVLGIERVGIDDNFFDLGGDSLSAALLFARTARQTGRWASRTITPM